MTAIHDPCEQGGLLCGDDSQYQARLEALYSFRARDFRPTLSFLGVCWGATNGPVILQSDRSSHTFRRDSEATLPAATFVNNADPCGHGLLSYMIRNSSPESIFEWRRSVTTTANMLIGIPEAGHLHLCQIPGNSIRQPVVEASGTKHA